MSVPEEDRRKRDENCNNRGFGLAAVAIGVGVGAAAALYYLVTKQSENPHGAGSSSRGEELFRKRSWTLEECSVCCEVMLKEHRVRRLPCSHNFHEACVEPWFADHDTCPNCRKKV